MKFLFDLFPVILFFGAYVATDDIYVATAVAIVASIVQVAYVWIKHRKVDTMLWVSFAVILVMGTLTLVLHDKRFIMWKPTLLYWVLAIGCIVSMLGFKKNPIKALMGKQLQLPPKVWTKLNWSWAGFCVFMGVLNLYVAFNFSEASWVKFKMFGGPGLMVVFIFLQALFLAKYVDSEETK
jgi:intracellular septation protein